MTRAEILNCLTDRPCDSCKFHESGRCERWDCVFEEKPDDAMQLGRKQALEEVYERIRDLFNFRIRVHNKDFDGAKTEKYRYDLTRDAHEFSANFNMILDEIQKMIGEPENERTDTE